jgi:hypothetical protein
MGKEIQRTVTKITSDKDGLETDTEANRIGLAGIKYTFLFFSSQFQIFKKVLYMNGCAHVLITHIDI